MTAAEHPGVGGTDPRRCGLFGCLEVAVRIVRNPQGGELAACEIDLDVLLNDALSRVPVNSTVRVEVRRA